MIRFPCECGRQVQARDEDVGRKARCPQCGRIMLVPDEAELRRIRQAAPDDDEPDERDERFREADDDDAPRRRRRGRAAADETTSGKATAALVLGIFSLCLPVVPAIPAIILGALALRDIGRSRGEVGGRGLAIGGIVTACCSFVLLGPVVMAVGILLPAVQKVRGAAARMKDSNNLKQLAIAMHNFNDVHGRLPQAAAFQTRDGKPGLSWRVALLPYVEQEALYQQFKLDEAWDSPHNRALLGRIPPVYLRPDQPNDGSGMTYYQVFTGPGTLFDPAAPAPAGPAGPGKPLLGLRLPADVPDGMANTILIATARNLVPWTRPDDLRYAPGDMLPPLGGHLPAGFNVAFADGSVRLVPQNTPDPVLRAAITRNGNEAVNLP